MLASSEYSSPGVCDVATWPCHYTTCPGASAQGVLCCAVCCSLVCSVLANMTPAMCITNMGLAEVRLEVVSANETSSVCVQSMGLAGATQLLSPALYSRLPLVVAGAA